MPELLKTLRQVGMEWREDKGWRIGAVTGRLIIRENTQVWTAVLNVFAFVLLNS